MATLNPEGSFDALKDRVSDAVESMFPYEGKDHRLEVARVWVDDTKSIDDIRAQQKSKLEGRTWSVPVMAEVTLVNKTTGKSVDHKTVRVANLPKITRRYSYIVDGKEWQVDNQFRLKSGVYHRVSAAGLLESQWNAAKGLGFRLRFDPNKRRFLMAYGDANVPLYPVLKALGVDDDTIEQKLGRGLLEAGKEEKAPQALRAFYKTSTGKVASDDAVAAIHVRETLLGTKLREDSTKVTLGKKYDHVSGEALLASAVRLLDMSRGKGEGDNREHLFFKDVLSIEDFVAERLTRNAWKIRKKLENNIDRKSKVREIVTPDLFDRPIRSFFTTTQLSQMPDQINPLEFVSGATKTTVMGEGGISSTHLLEDSTRLIDPTHLGFLDPIHTPEGDRTGITLQLPLGVSKKGNTLFVRAYNTKTGRMMDVDPHKAYESIVAFPDQYTWKDGKPTPMADRVTASAPGGDVQQVAAKDVDYVLRSPKGLFGVSANLIPFLQNNQGNRAMTASRQQEQAVPLVDREAPLVQTKTETAQTFEDIMGLFNSHRAPDPGTVVAVRPDAVVIKTRNGDLREVQLYDHFPLNESSSVLNSEPTVKVGDTVKKGDLVSDTNFTRGGKLALGRNLRVAYIPYKGYNFEDGIVISESAAKKLTSSHMHRNQLTVTGQTILDKKRFRAYTTPDQVAPELLDKLDDEGIVRVGQTVNEGDILVAALKKAQPTSETRALARLHKSLVRDLDPKPVTWDKDTPGKVVRVVRYGKSVSVHVATAEPARVGDKLVGRHGNKGVITCHCNDTQILTLEGWKFFWELTLEDKVCTLNPETRAIEFHRPDRIINEPYDGLMYRYEGRRLDLCVTPMHSHYVRTRRGKRFRLERAEQCFGLPRIHLRTGDWKGQEIERVVIPGAPHVPNAPYAFTEPREYDADTFLEFFGYWVTEGCTGQGKVNLGQRRSKNPKTYDKMVDVVRRMGYTPYEYPDLVGFSDPRLVYWLQQFGTSKTKFIPRQFLEVSSRQLSILADAAFAGDGGIYFREKDNHTRHELFTNSPRLADDYQEIALKVGKSANVKPQYRTRTYQLVGGSEHTVDTVEFVVRWSDKPEVWTNNDKRYDNESWVGYQGTVHCVEVPNHVVYVRRNGIPVWSGNSILPDHEMPQVKDEGGEQVDVLLNPAGVPGRINLGQVLETAAGKLARQRGKRYVVNNFGGADLDYTKELTEELKRAGVDETDELVDPVSKKSLGKVLTGDQYMLKLKHQVTKKAIARAGGAGMPYNVNGVPRGGGPHGAQAMDALGMYAMIGHGAKANIREMATYKSGRNDDLWELLQAGEPLPPPSTSFAFEKFTGYLNVLGINMHKQGNSLNLAPITDAQVLEMSNGELKDAGLMFQGKDLKPERDGLFDPYITGGVDGCFHPDVLVWTEDGMVPIGQIVRERRAVQVWSYDYEAGRFILSPVTGWFKNRSDEGIGRAVFSAPGRLGARFSRFSPTVLWGTRGHQVYDGAGNKRDLASADALVGVQEVLSPSQLQIVYGSLLGDGHLTHGHFSETHSAAQEEYLEFKAFMLAPVAGRWSPPTLDTSGGCSRWKVRFRTRAHACFHDLHARWYPAGSKQILRENLDVIDALGLAVWFMDDGSARRGAGKSTTTVVLCTHGYSRDGVGVLQTWLAEEWGLHTWLARDHKKYGQRDLGWAISLAGASADKFLDIIAPYIPPSMEHKLPGRPTMRACSCGREVPATFKYCNACLLAEARACGAGKLPRVVRDRFGGTASAREILDGFRACPNDPRGPLDQWEQRQARVGVGLAAVLEDTEMALSLQQIPCEYRWGTGARWEQTKTVYDIEVGGVHNYFANGILVSNSRWSHVRLAEALPNPVFEKAIQAFTGLTNKQYHAVVAGEEDLNGRTGPEAIREVLNHIDVDKELLQMRKEVPGLSDSKLAVARKKIRYLEALDALDLSMEQAYFSSVIPVLPPAMRPVSVMENGKLNEDDVNGLYKYMAITNNQLRDFDPGLPKSERAKLVAELYDNLRALTMTGATINGRHHRGVMETMQGVPQPKNSFFQNNLITRRQDLSMRSTIIPEPSMGLDEVGIPYKLAKETYRPFVVRRLVKLHGYTPNEAKSLIKKNAKAARTALEEVMEDRPVLLKRDPVLHKFGVMAFKPKLVGGKAIRIHPLVTSGFNADFDGDQQLGSVIVRVSSSVYNADRQFWAARRCSMTARFFESVPTVVAGSGVFAVCNLEDFPHEDLISTKGHIDFYAAPEGVDVVTLDAATGEVRFSPVSGWSVHHDREVEIVTLGSGRQIVTDDDERAVYGVDASSLEWCRRRPSEAADQFVPVLNDSPFLSTTDWLPLDVGRTTHEVLKLDERAGYFFGAMVGDGWVVHSEQAAKGICFSSSYEDVQEAWEQSLKSLYREIPTISQAFGDEDRLKGSEGSWRSTITHAALGRWLEPFIGHAARNKHLPTFYLSASTEFLLGMLAGLFDTDGSISWSNAKNKPQLLCSYSSTSIRLVQEVQYLLRHLGVPSTITPTKTPKGLPAWLLGISSVGMHALGPLPLAHRSKREALEEFLGGPPPDRSMAYSRHRLVPLPAALAKELRHLLGSKKDHSVYVTLSKATDRQYVSKEMAVKILELVPACAHPLYKKWEALVMEPWFHFERVTSYTRTGQRETGYDLTVPGPEVFMSADGVVLSNTMSAYVPMSEEAIVEARKMFPSNNLFSPTHGKLMYQPGHETQLGLYRLTGWGKRTSNRFKDAADAAKHAGEKNLGLDDVITVGGRETTLGRLLLDKALPEDMRGDVSLLYNRGFKLDAGATNTLLTTVAKDHPNHFGEVVNQLKDLGNSYAYESGFSFSLKDFKAQTAARNAILGPVNYEAQRIQKRVDLSQGQKDQMAITLYTKATQDLSSSIRPKLERQGNNALELVTSGARGNWDQLRQILIAPMLVKDAADRIVPVPILKSYSEGLDSAGYFTALHGARKGMIQKTKETSKPGALTKDIVNSAMNLLVVDGDAPDDADDGIRMEVGDREMLGRFLSKPVKLKGGDTLPRNTTLTPEIITRLSNSGVNHAQVRSPLRSVASRGLYARDYGLMPDGKLPEPGTNIGVLASQALGEPATQLSMKAFHEGGVAASKSGRSTDSFTRVEQLLKMPATLPDAATLAQRSGTVGKVEKDRDVGGLNMWIGDTRHYIPEHLVNNQLQLRRGKKVKRGERLSGGPVDPRELLPLTSINTVRNYLTDEVYKAYSGAGVKRNNVETVIRAITNLARVTDSADDPDLLRGDLVSISQMTERNKGKKAPVKFTPVLRGVTQTPLDMQEDWMARMQYQRLKDTVVDAGLKGWGSDIHGFHPIPSLAYGAEFGVAPVGKTTFTY